MDGRRLVSLGCVAYYLLTGHHVFRRNSDQHHSRTCTLRRRDRGVSTGYGPRGAYSQCLAGSGLRACHRPLSGPTPGGSVSGNPDARRGAAGGGSTGPAPLTSRRLWDPWKRRLSSTVRFMPGLTAHLRGRKSLMGRQAHRSSGRQVFSPDAKTRDTRCGRIRSTLEAAVAETDKRRRSYIEKEAHQPLLLDFSAAPASMRRLEAESHGSRDGRFHSRSLRAVEAHLKEHRRFRSFGMDADHPAVRQHRKGVFISKGTRRGVQHLRCGSVDSRSAEEIR